MRHMLQGPCATTTLPAVSDLAELYMCAMCSIPDSGQCSFALQWLPCYQLCVDGAKSKLQCTIIYAQSPVSDAGELNSQYSLFINAVTTAIDSGNLTRRFN